MPRPLLLLLVFPITLVLGGLSGPADVDSVLMQADNVHKLVDANADYDDDDHVNIERLAHELLAQAATIRSQRSGGVKLDGVARAPDATKENFGAVRTAAKVLALIPARSGSKSVPHKNIRLLGGKPMLAHSIEHAKQASLVDRVLVSTDSEQYQGIAIQFGAEAPFLRPASMAEDASPDLPLFRHAVKWLAEHEDYVPDLVLHLRPTCPIRHVADIDRALAVLLDHPEFTAVRSVSPSKDNPWRMWFSEEGMHNSTQGAHMHPIAIPPGNKVYPVYTTGMAGNTPRQLTPVTYSQNSCIDVVRASTLMAADGGSMTGTAVYGLITPELPDIDTEADFARAQSEFAGI